MVWWQKTATGAAALLLATLVPLLLLLPGGEEPAEDPAADGNPVFGLYAPGTVNELPASAGRQMIAALGLGSVEEYQDYSLSLVRESGAGWVRVDFRYTGWSFDYPDYLLERLRDAGVEVIGCVRPLNSQAPADLRGFKEELGRLMDRFPWIRVWQIGNEPDLSWREPEDFVRLFLAAEAVVRERCPDCRVALAGAAALFPGHQDSLPAYDSILGTIARETAGRPRPPFDILDLHFYQYAGAEGTILATMGEFRSLLARHGFPANTGIWVTENATTSGDITWPAGSPAQSEEQQAGELWRRFTVLLGAGIERVSWARPYENYRYAERYEGFFDHAGLVYNGLGQEEGWGVAGGTRKLAFYAYRVLTEKLRGFATVDCLAPGQYRFRFDDGRPPVFILWSDGGAPMPAGVTGPVTVTSLAGDTRRVDASELLLGWVPVMVE